MTLKWIFNPLSGEFDLVDPGLSLADIDRLTSITSNPGDTLVLTSTGSQLTLTGTPNIVNLTGAYLWGGNTAGVGTYYFYDGASNLAQMYFVNPAAPSTELYFWRYDTVTGYMTLLGGAGIGSPGLHLNNMDLIVDGKTGSQKSIVLGTAGVGATLSMIFRTATDQYLRWNNLNSRFEFSDNLKINGSIEAASYIGVDEFLTFFNGTFQETFDATVASDGATITLSLEQTGGGDLTMRFSDGKTTLDCTPADTVALTAGSDASPQENFVYIPQATKVLTVSTSNWSTDEHIKVAYVLCQSAATVNTKDVLVNQNWNDHAAGTNNQGHMTHMAERSRRLGAVYYSGAALTPTISTAPAPDELDIAVAAGVIYQMHQQSFPVFDTSSGDEIFVVNHPTAAYTATSDLETEITSDATGSSLSNKYFNIIIWGVANKGAESFSPVMCNLPSGSYNSESDAINDIDGYDVFTIPDPFIKESSTGFLLAKLTLKFGAGTNTLSLSNQLDLRGFSPNTATGAGTGMVTTEFPDNQFKILDDGDATKIAQFEASGITTATTRTFTFPDQDGTIALRVDGPVTLSDAATIAVDASLGSIFDVTLGGDRTMGNPTNPTDGQKIMFRIWQDGAGSRTISWDTDYRFGDYITSTNLNGAAGSLGYAVVTYSATNSKWDIVNFQPGY